MTEQDKIMQELRRMNDELEDKIDDLRIKNSWLTEQLAGKERPEEKMIICKRAVDTYGWRMQSVIAMEEMAELIKELSKALRSPSLTNHDALVEGMADVQIMWNQMRYMFDISDKQLDAMTDLKLSRLWERLTNAE